MINPQPVNDRRSPYSTGPATVTPNRQPSALPSVLKPSRPRRWKKILGLTILTIFAAGATYAYAQYRSLKNNILVEHEGENSAILGYDPNDKNSKLDLAQFKEPGDGRFNIVLVGIGGENHPGGNLTDSIQVLSIDTINKKIVTTSIPRDLYVTIPGSGRAKINTAYYAGEQKKTGGGAAMVREVVGTVLGTKISNFALIDFSGMKDIVDALGGIDINVPTAINDQTYPDDKNVGYSPFVIKAGPQHMNGTTALKYARSRHSSSDFDRARRQQEIIAAMKAKALSAGVLANPVKVNNLITALGKHFKTDMSLDQIKSVISIYKDIPANASTSHVLDTSTQLGLLTSITDPTAGYISYPVLGIDKFEAVNQWFAKNAPDPLLAKETPTLTLVNSGKATTKQLQDYAEKLKDYGYSVTISTEQATKSKYTSTQVFQTKTGEKKTVSKNYLGSITGQTVQNNAPFNSTSDFEIVYAPSTK